MAKKLIATYPILYESKMYAEGEPLPANNHEMTKIWLKAKTAKWDGADENEQEVNDKNKNNHEEINVQSLGNIDKNDNNKESSEDNLKEQNTEANEEVNSQSLGNIDNKDNEKGDNSDSNIESKEEETTSKSKKK